MLAGYLRLMLLCTTMHAKGADVLCFPVVASIEYVKYFIRNNNLFCFAGMDSIGMNSAFIVRPDQGWRG